MRLLSGALGFGGFAERWVAWQAGRAARRRERVAEQADRRVLHRWRDIGQADFMNPHYVAHLKAAVANGDASDLAVTLPNAPGVWASVLMQAAANNRALLIRSLLPRVTQEEITPALYVALFGGQAAAARVLLEGGADPDAFSALETFAELNQAWAVELLLPYVPSQERRSQALSIAAAKGFVSIVQALLPATDATADQSRALRAAALHGHYAAIGVLAARSNARAAFDVCVDARQWEAADRLAPYVPESDVRRLVRLAPHTVPLVDGPRRLLQAELGIDADLKPAPA